MSGDSERQRRLRLPLKVSAREALLGLLVTAALWRVGILAGDLAYIRKIELGLIDSRYRAHPERFAPRDTSLVIVDIDNDSYEVLPAVWPWPRSYYARLVRNLDRAGARLVVIDLVLDKGDRSVDGGDDSLASTLRRRPDVLLGGEFQWDLRNALYGNRVIYHGGEVTLALPHGPFLNADSSNWGLVNIEPDLDGVVRRYPVARRRSEEGRLYPSLAVRAFERLRGPLPADIASGPSFRIAYPGRSDAFRYVPFYQVVDDSELTTRDEEAWGEASNLFDTLLAQGVFRDKIVFVGASMPDLHDLKLTPFSRGEEGEARRTPGVEIHVAALHTLLEDHRIAEAGPLRVRIVLALVCLGVFLLGIVVRTWVVLPASLAVIYAWYAAAFGLYEAESILVPVAMPVATVALVTFGHSAFLFVLERRRRTEIAGMFGRYVPREVVRELVRDPAKMRLGGERRELSVLFSDVEGFTSISEAMGPEQLVELLNEYLTAMTRIVHAHGGIIDKYEGDAIMAEFGIPLAVSDHALRACRAAFLMQKRLYELREKWAGEGRPLLRARVGIGSGIMVFGNMGSTQAFDYTVMGDVVNLASRLEGANKNYGTYVMANQRAAELVEQEMYTREMDLLRVKGKQVPERCYQVLAPRGCDKSAQIERVRGFFAEGVAYYRDRKWDKAIERFEAALAVWPDDQPSAMYIERCRGLLADPPGADWDGVYTMTTK